MNTPIKMPQSAKKPQNVHSGNASRNDVKPRGANARYVSSNRSNFSSGLS